MLIRGQAQEVDQGALDTYRTQLLNCTIEGDNNIPPPEEPELVDLGNDGIPDLLWRRVDIINWLKVNEVYTRAGLTKAQLIVRVDEHLNPPVEEEVTEENNSGDDLGTDEEELQE